MKSSTLGEPRLASDHSHTVLDDPRIPEKIETGESPGILFEEAGPRRSLYFDAPNTTAGIVTCGGLCPGLNNVIRSLYHELHFGYGVQSVLGFRDGYCGLDPDRGAAPFVITPDFVHGIHLQGGTVLGSSRGPVAFEKAVENLMARKVNVLFTVGGDGTQRGARDLYLEAQRRGYPLSIVGVPKTIDNDIPFVAQSFGFFTAVQEAVRVLECAHTEAHSVPAGIGLVKLMGRHAGFITAAATVGSQDVNFALIPEVPFSLERFLAALKARMHGSSHAVIAVAEGAGQHLVGSDLPERDASGNLKLKDIGRFLRSKIEEYFHAEGIPAVLRYFDPSYQIRSRPAGCEDALLCDLFARHAVHAAMAGKTGIVIGYIHGRFVHVPIELLATQTKRLDPNSGWWRSVLAATGQPRQFT